MNRLNKKAFRDIFHDKFRIFLTLFAIILGTTAFGSILFSYTIVNRELVNVYDATNPVSGSITVDNYSPQIKELTQNFSDISEFEIKAAYKLRMPQEGNQPMSLTLFGVEDFEHMKVATISQLQGNAHPNNHELLLERDALQMLGASIGDTLPILLPDANIKTFNIVGTVNDITLHPASMHRDVYAFVTFDTLESLGLTPNRVDFKLTQNTYDRDTILAVGNQYIHMLEQNGYHISSFDVLQIPGQSIHMGEYSSVLFILQVCSIVAFLFGCMIMSSLLSTILNGQVKQIGILKSIGAQSRAIQKAYMLACILLILINFVISLPLSIAISKALANVFMSIGNMDVLSSAIPLSIYLLFIAAILITPILIAFFPIRRGLHITVKEALNSFGHPQESMSSKKTSAHNYTYLPRPIVLSLQNAVRHKSRFLLNLATLSFGGAIFVAIMTTMSASQNALLDNFNTMHYDYQVITTHSVDEKHLASAIENTDSIKNYESWGVCNGKIKYSDGQIGNLYTLYAPSYDTPLLSPELMNGRWLQEGDINAVVVNYELLLAEPTYHLGDTITLQIGSTSCDFQIVGVTKEQGSPIFYINADGFMNLIPEESRLSAIKIVTTSEKTDKENIYADLEENLKNHDIRIFTSASQEDQYKIMQGHYSTTLTSFLVVAIMVIIVAAFGLTSTMSVQVSERTKEIGIMKSIGASGKQIIHINTSESIFISLMSWFVSIVIGIPLSMLSASIFGQITLKFPLSVDITDFLIPYLIWLVLTFVVGYQASKNVAKKASRLSIKETLAFE